MSDRLNFLAALSMINGRHPMIYDRITNPAMVIGTCPICERDMIKDLFVDKHHFLPKCRGGKESEYVHKICHNKIHSIWTEKELEAEFHDPEKVKAHPEMQKFIKWVKKKEPDFYDKNEQHTRKKR